jgi:hypothetical protein
VGASVVCAVSLTGTGAGGVAAACLQADTAAASARTTSNLAGNVSKVFSFPEKIGKPFLLYQGHRMKDGIFICRTG